MRLRNITNLLLRPADELQVGTGPDLLHERDITGKAIDARA